MLVWTEDNRRKQGSTRCCVRRCEDVGLLVFACGERIVWGEVRVYGTIWRTITEVVKMAVLYPNVEDIKILRPAPTEGEWRLVQFLAQHLDDSYEIFFQPCLNGDNPDVIVMRKGSGVLITKVKDWLLQSYYIDDKNRWRLKEKKAPIKSPLEQVLEYKENLFDLHIESLLDKDIRPTILRDSVLRRLFP